MEEDRRWAAPRQRNLSEKHPERQGKRRWGAAKAVRVSAESVGGAQPWCVNTDRFKGRGGCQSNEAVEALSWRTPDLLQV